MVIGNLFEDSQDLREKFWLASPWFRGASFLLDLFVVILPVTSLFSFLNISFISFVLISGIYSGICLSLYQRTLGQLIVGLYTTDEAGKSLSFSMAFFRGIFCALSVLACFIPCLKIFKDEERRQTFHDKIANSLVGSVSKERSQYQISLNQIHLLNSFSYSILYFTIFFSVGFYFSNNVLTPKRELASQVPQVFCEEVTKQANISLEDRLKTSISLFKKNKITKKCLKKEVNASFCNPQIRKVSYIGQSLLYKDDKEVSGKYLESACLGFKESKEKKE